MHSESQDSAFLVYIDESGNTGDAALTTSLLGTQPSFALVAVAEVAGSQSLDSILDHVRRGVGLGGTELKGRAMDRYPHLLRELVQALHNSRTPVFVELMDKSFFVAANIVNHVLGISRLPLGNPDVVFVQNAMADVITEHLGTPVIAPYCEFARAPSKETFRGFVSAFRQALLEVSGVMPELEQVLLTMSQILDEEIHEAQGSAPEGYERFLPPPDYIGRGKRVAMLPHVPAFTHLYGRINRFVPDGQEAKVIHDEQLQVGPALAEYAARLQENDLAELLSAIPQSGIADWNFGTSKLSFTFSDSKAAAGIQIADLLARFVTRRFNSLMAGRELPNDPVLSLLFSMNDEEVGVGTNLVTSTRSVSRFWGSAMV